MNTRVTGVPMQLETSFFTVNLTEWRFDILMRHIDDLRAIWRLPLDDADYPLSWSLIKAGFSQRLVKGEHIRTSR